MSPSIERTIAGKAKELVEQRKEETERHENESEYRALCESFPILLRSAGLAQSVAFLRAKGAENRKAKEKNSYAHLYDHLQQQFRNLQFLSGAEALSERAASPQLAASEYRLYTEIAMRIALWHKRMAQAMLRQRKAKP